MVATKTMHCSIMGCLLLLAALCLAGNVAARNSDFQPIDSTDGIDGAETMLRGGRQLMQGGDGGNGGDGGDSNGSGDGGDGGDGGKGGDSFDGGLGGDGGNGGNGGNSNSAGDGGNGGTGGDGGNSNSFPQLDCGFGEYVLNNKCTKCVSKSSTASAAVLRGVKCSKPFGVNNPTSCNFGFLSGLQIQSSKNSNKVATCIDSKSDSVTLYVPVKGFRFFGVKTTRYLYNTISLAGYPLLPVAGIPLSYNYPTKVNGIRVDALVFEGTSQALRGSRGKGIALNGVLNVKGNFNLCFAATAEVC